MYDPDAEDMSMEANVAQGRSASPRNADAG